MNAMNHPLIRYHGGKFRIAEWVISHFPIHKTYVEPFGGGASVLMKKEPSSIEVYNDIDSEVVNLFKVLRNEEQRQKLEEQLSLTPFSRDEFYQAYQDTDCPVEKARRMIIRAQMGFGSAGATKGSTGFRMAGGRQKNYEISLWDRYPERLAFFAKRLKQVLIENQPATKVISLYDHPETLFFVDPPYVTSTRTANVVAYRYELDDQDHIELINLLLSIQGKVVLSGYEHPIYDSRLDGWKKVTRSVQASGNRGWVSRQECLWISPNAQHQDLFGGIHV
ncbi:DNA adenine methylase [Acinetobacter pittii]|uniref:DNA adenine methylase n=1 Tax=Acinetobacter pittii TaxID=48296 RepID=UPI00053C04D4|nr:DNA adenine methylase [Acinetobacter pittii]MDR0067241.1 DNA adenine methylase [Acinetobacter sp. 11520]KQG03556.1 DNA methyltransferase [Acinetobacter pittii]MBM0876627.1 DNA adenine methylase [Acinetobacter pittii]MCU4617853.1 DNA adenine methylase [Acinetobacter pittii]OCY63407.1 DNA methyltransferase [Acinetobacter pittii]